MDLEKEILQAINRASQVSDTRTITLNITEPKIPDFVKTTPKKTTKKSFVLVPEVKKRGRPKKNA